MATQPPLPEPGHKSSSISYEARAMNGRDVRSTFDTIDNVQAFILRQEEKKVKYRIFKVETTTTEITI